MKSKFVRERFSPPYTKNELWEEICRIRPVSYRRFTRWLPIVRVSTEELCPFTKRLVPRHEFDYFDCMKLAAFAFYLNLCRSESYALRKVVEAIKQRPDLFKDPRDTRSAQASQRQTTPDQPIEVEAKTA